MAAAPDTLTPDSPEPEEAVARIPVWRLIAIAAEFYGLSRAEVVGPGRHKRFMPARRAVALVALELGYSSPLTGRAMGGRDHSSVLHHRDLARHMLLRDPVFAVLVEGLRSAALNWHGERVAALKQWIADVAARPCEVIPPAPRVTEERCPAEVGHSEKMRIGTEALLAAIARDFPGRVHRGLQ